MFRNWAYFHGGIMKTFFNVWKLMVVGLAFVASAAFAQSGQVVDLQGTATAQVVPAAVAGQPAPAPGAIRTLRLGDNINQGETISTGANSRLALRFDDGQIVSLSAKSSFRIDAYVYNRAEPARSNVLFNLINGGMRAVTGLIGKASPQAVTYRAGNATIGIRGTDVTFAINGGNLIVNVNTGQITSAEWKSSCGLIPISCRLSNCCLTPIFVQAGRLMKRRRDQLVAPNQVACRRQLERAGSAAGRSFGNL